MKIDFNKLVELLLPTFLRRPRILAMLRVLVAKPLQQLFVKFHIWRLKSRYEASVSPQVISLIHAIERTFDCVAEITELDGKPYDFLVSIDRSADLNAIREFIDKHKLAGKSYIFKLGDAAFSVTWISYVDEYLVEEYTATWIEHIDASGIVCNIRAFWNNLNYPDFPEITRGRVIDLDCSEAVTSDLVFTLKIEIIRGGNTSIITETTAIEEGERVMMRMADEQDTFNIPYKIISVTVSPESDEHHYYELNF